MALFDLLSDVKTKRVLDPANRTASTTGDSTVDTSGYESAALLFSIGSTADTLSAAVNWSVRMEESDDNSTWTAVAEADLTDPIAGTTTGEFAFIDAAAEDDLQYACGYLGSKRYIRLHVVHAGTHTGGSPMSCIAILSNAFRRPVVRATS